LRKLPKLLAITGAFVAFGSVLSAYIIKTHWLSAFDWNVIAAQTNTAIALALSLHLMAWWARRVARRTKVKTLRRPLLFVFLCGVLVLASLISVGRIAARVTVGLTAKSPETSSHYNFTSDWVTGNQVIWAEHLKHLKDKPAQGLEIGSFEGRSLLWFLENTLTHPGSSITAIDIFLPEYEQIFDDNIARSGLQNKVKKLKGYSNVALRGLPANTYDFVYIDGSHIAKDVLMDAVLVWDILKPGGMIIFDDYQNTGPRGANYGPARLPGIAIDAFLHVYEPYVDVLYKDYQVIIRKKKVVDLDSQKYGILARVLKSFHF
jgi:SAM-dependent methyltransferase